MAESKLFRTGAMTMRHTKESTGKTLLTALCCGVLAAAVLAPATAQAWRSGYGGRGYGGYGSGSGYGRQSQNRAYEQADEQRREGQRQKNREELMERKDAYVSEYGASQEAIRQASKAAERAPRDAFYRAPGFTTKTLPGAAVKLDVGGSTYHYFRGLFYAQLPGNYIVIPAPVGAVVDSLPEGTTGAVYKGDAETYFYYFGTFFAKEGDKFKTVVPPAGTAVGYIPDGYSETGSEESVLYKFGDITYQPYMWQSNLIYRVVQG
jgi:hypothetical protein